eukprot:6278945-Amphidinium_carterae.1
MASCKTTCFLAGFLGVRPTQLRLVAWISRKSLNRHFKSRRRGPIQTPKPVSIQESIAWNSFLTNSDTPDKAVTIQLKNHEI